MTGDARTRRLAGIVALAAVIAGAATLFGNEYAPEATHAEAGAEAEHAEAEEAEEEEHREEETSAGQVAGAILISIGGVALVPLTAPLACRRKREERVGEAIAAAPEAGVDRLRVGLALLSIGAAVIHFAVIAQHLNEWWLTGTFFVVVALFQLAWAIAVLARPSPALYLIGALVNALVVITWIVSRTVGVPVGPEAGEAESIGLPDALATGYEALLVGAAAALALRAGAAARLRPLGGAIATWTTAVAVVALTALTLALLP
jgi:hypothetical protein